MTIVGIVLGVYLLLLGGVTLTQRQMMYFPTRAPLGALDQLARDQRFEAWKNKTGENIGWKRLSGASPAAGQVLILHGNGGQALNWASHADAIQKVGAFDVYILEYPGYGARPGKPKQKTIYPAATEAISLLQTNSPIYLFGESLGTGVATYLASSGKVPVAGVFLVAPYNNMAAVGQHHMRIFPVRLVLWDRYSSDKHLKNYHGPVGFVLGGRDTVIPNRYGRRLFEGYKGPKRLWEFPEAGHDDLHYSGVGVWKEAWEFFRSHSAQPTAPQQ